MDLNQSLGVKGFCFRHFRDNRQVARMVRDIGLDRIDLSSPQLDFKNPDAHDDAIAAYREAGVRIVGVGVTRFDGDEPREKNVFEFCRKAGCSTISIALPPQNHLKILAMLERLADEYDMRLAIHNHGGKHWLGNSQILRYLLDETSDRVGLCIDTAWAIQAGENPVKWLELFAGRVYAVHYKDFIFDRHGKHQDTIVGEGSLDLSAFVDGLRAIRFSGPAVIEYEAEPENPVPALKRCVEAMRTALSREPAGAVGA